MKIKECFKLTLAQTPNVIAPSPSRNRVQNCKLFAKFGFVEMGFSLKYNCS